MGMSGLGRRCRPILEVLEDRCVPAVFMVDRSTDSMAHNAANTAGTLRWCLIQAQNGDTVTFDPSQTLNVILQAPLPEITNNITIHGEGANRSIVSRDVTGPANFRIFKVDLATTCTIENLRIAHGTSDGAAETNGGGISNRGFLTLSNVEIVNCSAVDGGGIKSFGPTGGLSMMNCLVYNCSASD